MLRSYLFLLTTKVKYILLRILNYENLKVISLFIQRKLALASFTTITANQQMHHVFNT